MTLRALSLLLLALAPACHHGAAALDIPADLRIPVEVDGRAVAPIDAATLHARAPDWAEGGRRAWRLQTLLGSALARPGCVLEVEDLQGITSRFVAPAAKGEGREVVLMLNQHGEMLVGPIQPRDRARAFHGRGDNGGPAADLTRPLKGIRALRVRIDDALAQAPLEQAQIALMVVVDGAPPITWTRTQLAGVRSLAVRGDSGEGKREGWSLRDLVSTLVDDQAAVVRLKGEGGRVMPIEAALWRDATRLPVLRLNRRGQLKFNWMSSAGQPDPGEGLRGVSEIQIQHGTEAHPY
ncbi:MAG TPA: hypothetical protein VKN99_02195 [Polyangia bacterium]|nr:hypothetical protein [Polyangia bacterium]